STYLSASQGTSSTCTTSLSLHDALPILCKLITDVGKLDTLAERVGRHPANPVRVHGLIRDAGLCGMGFAVALILADDGLYFPLFGTGELYRRLVSLLFGQSHLPPFPFGAAA